jgi:phospholipid-binding lipoprotein MlaA
VSGTALALDGYYTGVTMEAKPASPTPAAVASDEDADLYEYEVVEIKDPLEKINRATFWFNDKLYAFLLRPISKGYQAITPKRFRNGVNNAFENVKFPVRLVNSLLQGKIKRAGQHTGKFLLNTVVGLGGLIRVSDKVEALAHLPEEDTGKTFGVWGMGHGCYLVLPLLGPSSLRDGIGLAGDYAMNPVNWGFFQSNPDTWMLLPPYGNTLRALPAQLSFYDDSKRDAIDPYIAIHSAYAQYRAEMLKKK